MKRKKHRQLNWRSLSENGHKNPFVSIIALVASVVFVALGAVTQQTLQPQDDIPLLFTND